MFAARKMYDNRNCEKTVTRHVWHDCVELAEDVRYTPEYIGLYEKRKKTLERVFTDVKEKHGILYAFYQGLAQVTKWVSLGLLL